MSWQRLIMPVAVATAFLPGAVAAQALEFPLRAEDLRPGMRLSTGNHGEDGEIQDFGLDIVAMRHIGNDTWHPFVGQVPDPTDVKPNDTALIYGMPFHAMESGEVVGCWRNAPENPSIGPLHPEVPKENDPGRMIPGGNHLWIRHDDGTVALYAHAIPGTIPEKLCPNKPLALAPTPVTGAGGHPDVDPEARVPNGVKPTVASGTILADGTRVVRPKVKRGQLLGRVGNSGASSAPHLHVHLESGFGASMPLRMRFARGMAAFRTRTDEPYLHKADIDDWVSFAGSSPPDRDILIWPPRTITREVSRVGMGIEAFGRVFDHLHDSGFMPELIDCYAVGGKSFLNMVWRPARGPWFAIAGADEKRFLEAFLEADGLEPFAIDSCGTGAGVRYAAIFRDLPGRTVARRDLRTAEHDDLFQQMVEEGMTPASISVVSVEGQRRYTVLYNDRDIGPWTLKSQLQRTADADEYDAFVDQAVADGLKPVYVNAYMHDGVQNFVSIVAKRPDGDPLAVHNRSTAQMRGIIESAVFEGFRTRSLAGVDGAMSAHRHAGVWIDPPPISIDGGLVNPVSLNDFGE